MYASVSKGQKIIDIKIVGGGIRKSLGGNYDKAGKRDGRGQGRV